MRHLAVDLGATGGAILAGTVTPDAVETREVHRFDNRPVERDGRYVWDVARLLEDVAAGIERAGDVDTVGVDTWGVDFGLFRGGELLRDPVSYRDPAVSSTFGELVERVSRREIFEATGITNWNTPNTLWQYHHLATREPDVLAAADRLLMMPQALARLLGGEPAGEVTVASTTQLLDVRDRAWATDLLARLDLPADPLPEPAPPGTRVGSVDPEIAPATPDLVLPASHDTASAVAGLPLTDGPAFLSTGTWFVVGVELDAPRITDAAFEAGASNELGVDAVRFLSNVTGFFLLEECRESWRAAGEPHGYDHLLDAAAGAAPFGPLVNPDDPAFDIEGDTVAAVREYCRATDQAVPGDQGALTRCLMESLAARTAVALDSLLEAAGESTGALHVGGGGVRNDLFCRLLASAIGRPVLAGPVEATATGNLLVQARAAGAIDSVAEGRTAVAEHVERTRYEPDGDPRWAEARARMRELVGTTVGG